jgi:hypothetical protein
VEAVQDPHLPNIDPDKEYVLVTAADYKYIRTIQSGAGQHEDRIITEATLRSRPSPELCHVQPRALERSRVDDQRLSRKRALRGGAGFVPRLGSTRLALRSEHELVGRSDSIVHWGGAPISCQQYRARLPYSRRDESIVDTPACQPGKGGLLDQAGVGSRGQNERRLREAFGQKGRDKSGRRSVRRRQPSQDRVGLHEDMSGDSWLPVENGQCGAMTLVPRSERGDHDTRIDGDHRRVDSSVARTSSSVRGGRSRSGTATRPPRRLTSVMGVASGSISIRPSRSRISTGLPRERPRRSRSVLGMTTRPAPSMADLMALSYHSYDQVRGVDGRPLEQRFV